ncbi:hypothetical protein MAR_017058 [Mya arenaria]|uniref:FLYWCH-type domain-containing protein n=1 Tax=Mya arenaria TaxID=6604 RepID=A0ABY7EAN3_MYAAR|nr:hypothetical protein MAR_017058 [Mya arenaria]
MANMLYVEMLLYSDDKLRQNLGALTDTAACRKVLQLVLKQEILHLLQRLSDAGEESVLLVAGVQDGSRSVLASTRGQHFVREPATVTDKSNQHVNSNRETESSTDRKPVRCISQSPPTPRPRGRPPNSERFAKLDEFGQEQKTDTVIDKTVSILVKNILTEGRRREQESMFEYERRSDQPEYQHKRKLGDGHPDLADRDSCGKKMRIAEFFPAISSQLSSPDAGIVNVRSERLWDNDNTRNTDDNNSVGQASEVGSSVESTIVVKTEPLSDTEYEYVLDKNVGEVSNKHSDKLDSQSNANGTEDDVNEDTACEDDKSNRRKQDISKTRLNSAGSKTTSDELSDESRTSVAHKTIHIEEDDIDLPFVEDYYTTYFGSSEEAVTGNKFRRRMNFPRKRVGYGVVDNQDGCGLSYTRASKAGHYNLVHDGFFYIRDKVGKSGTVYWKCKSPGCRGRVINRFGEITISKEHSGVCSYLQAMGEGGVKLEAAEDDDVKVEWNESDEMEESRRDTRKEGDGNVIRKKGARGEPSDTTSVMDLVRASRVNADS